MRYSWKRRLLRNRRVNLAWRYWGAWTGRRIGSYNQLPSFIRQHAPGRSFVDIGCMWGVNGAYAFLAEEAGATRVQAVDVFGPTPEFEAEHARRQSRVRFVLGDATAPATLAELGPSDVVFCAGVLYHLPSPFDLLVALRRLCGSTLILRTSTIPEIDGLPNAAVFYPMLPDRDRQAWSLAPLGLQHQVGISDRFDPEQGYGNWMWGITPSCLRSMLQVAGFAVREEWEEAFAHTVIAEAVETAFAHRLPGEAESRELAAAISAAGIAKPA